MTEAKKTKDLLSEIPPDYPRYEVGLFAPYDPQQDQEVNHMLYLIAYDISNPNRLRKVAKTCESYGARIEKSVFECDLPPERFEQLWKRLQNLVAEDEDALVAYAICKSCAKRVESAGALRRPDQRLMYCL